MKKSSTKHKALFVLLTVIILSVPAQQEKTRNFMDRIKPGQKKLQGLNLKTASEELSIPARSSNYYWSGSSLNWQFTDSSLYTYNAAGQLLSETSRNNGPVFKTTYTYDPQGRQTHALSENWDSFNNLWNPSSRQVTIYDNQNQQIEFRFDTYNTSNNQWEIMFGNKNLITYDANNRITDNISQSWNNTSLLWENSYRETAYVYDGNNNLTQFESMFYNLNTWENDTRYKLVYSLNNLPIQLEMELWNGTQYEKTVRYTNLTFHNWCGFYCEQTALTSGTIQTWGMPQANQWNTTSRIHSTYDVYGGYVQLQEDYQNNQWQNVYRYSETYDNQYKFTGYTSEDWNPINNMWDTSYASQQIHSYDASFNLLQTIWKFWNSSNNSMENDMKRVYIDFQFVVSLNEQKSDHTVKVYPNPVSSFLKIQSGKSPGENLGFKLLDVNGKILISEEIQDTEHSFQRQDLPSGIYFYQITKGQVPVKTGKIIFD